MQEGESGKEGGVNKNNSKYLNNFLLALRVFVMPIARMATKSSDRRIQVYLTDAEIKKTEKLKGEHKTRHRWATVILRKVIQQSNQNKS